MPHIALCDNCLQDGGKPYPVGQEFGHQRDPQRRIVQLCQYCQNCLEQANFSGLASRNRASIVINVTSEGHSK